MYSGNIIVKFHSRFTFKRFTGNTHIVGTHLVIFILDLDIFLRRSFSIYMHFGDLIFEFHSCVIIYTYMDLFVNAGLAKATQKS